MSADRRLLELDGLRGLAALAVVWFHFSVRYDEMISPRTGVWPHFDVGQYGVALFFMISGFVILMTLERTPSLADFTVARFSRLYPAYWAAMAVTYATIFFYGLSDLRASGFDALLNITMLQRLLGAEHVDGVYWSLQAELLFYVAICLLWFLGGRQRLFLFLTVWLLLGFASWLALPLLEQTSAPAAKLVRMASTLFNLPNIPLFACGIGLYRWYRERSRGGLMLVGLALTLYLLEHGWIEGLVASCLAGLLALGIFGHAPLLRSRLLVALGAISYTLYLIHQNVGYCLLHYLGRHHWNPNLGIVAAGVFSVFLATLLTLFIERPASAWIRNRWKKRLRTPEAPGRVLSLLPQPATN